MHVMKKVAAFMYGNRVGLSDAVTCYNACKVRHQRRVESMLNAWYDAWFRMRIGVIWNSITV